MAKERSGRLTLIISIIQDLIYLYTLVLIIYAVLSWIPGARESRFGHLINKLARPYIEIFDQFIPSFGGMTFSVAIGVLVLQLASSGLNMFY